jgi:hypothetical protein
MDEEAIAVRDCAVHECEMLPPLHHGSKITQIGKFWMPTVVMEQLGGREHVEAILRRIAPGEW